MTFALHPNLQNKLFLADLPLCRVLLEDDRHYPWLLAVPRRESVSRMMDLSHADQLQLMLELDFLQKAMWEGFRPEQLNVAAIGIKTPQLHVHIIARTSADPAWPATVWDHPVRSPYEEKEKARVIEKLNKSLLKFS